MTKLYKSHGRHGGRGVCTRREMLAGCGAALAASLGALQLGCSQIFPKRARGNKPNVLVFLADSLRADHLGCYGYGRPSSLNIDQMAQSSIVFENCYSQAPWTKPAIGSMFTGYLPPVHKAVLSTWTDIANWNPDNPAAHKVQMLRDNFDTVAGNFKNMGYQTAMFQTNPHCQQEFGFAQGFEHYRYVPSEPPEDQVNAVLEWFQQEAEAKTPFFVFVHEIDPHGPYVPPPHLYQELFGCLPEQAAAELAQHDLDILDGFKMRYVSGDFDMADMCELSPAGVEHLISLYDGEICGVDYQFQRLLDYLSQSGLDDNTIVVFISDHGEAFGEHGFFAHKMSLYDEELHVPMIIRLGNNGPGLRVPWNVNLYDLFPTLMTLAGGEYDDSLQAKSLITEDAHIAIDKDNPVLAYQDFNRPDRKIWQFCVIQDGYKVYDRSSGIEIYDRKKDPAETVNLYGKIAESDNLVTRAHDLRKKHLNLAKNFGEPEYAGADTDTLEELRALGYL